MKQALAFISALTFASAAQSDGFLSPDNELRIRPISYNPNEDSSPLEDFPQVLPKYFRRDPSPIIYVDDAEDNQQYAHFNLVQNWHYPLKPLPMNNPLPVQNQPNIEKDSTDNSLFNLGQMIQNTVWTIQKAGENIQKEGEVIHKRQEVRGDRAPPGHSSSIQDDKDDITIFLTVVQKKEKQRR